MRRGAFLASRLAAAARRALAPDALKFAQLPAGWTGGAAAAAAAAGAASLAVAAGACCQWGLAEAAGAPHPDHHTRHHQQQHQNEKEDGANCPECREIQLDDQPVAVSNSATAQWRVFTDMGRELVQAGRHGEAERYFKKAVEMAVEGFGEDDPHVASACNNLAEFYRLRRQYDLAEPLYKQALEILTKAYGMHDARVAFSLHNLGGFYLSRRQLDKAAECYEQAMRMKLEVLGTGHSETSNTMYHLAEVRWQQGQRDNAAQLLQQSLEIMEAQGVGATPGCVRRRGRLAEMLLELGRVGEAEGLLRSILAYVESTQGLEHANYAAAAENLAAALQRRGAWDDARGLMHRALEARSTHVGGRHPVVAVTLRKLAELELAAAAAEEAAAAAAAAEGAAEGIDGVVEGADGAEQAAADGVSGSASGGRTGGGAAAAGVVGASGAGAAAAAPPLRDRERQQAVAIAREALSIAQQAQREALDWQRRQGQPADGSTGGGWLLAWFRPATPQLSALRRPQRPDSAALEVAHCLQTLSHAHVAVGEEAAAAGDLQQAMRVLDEAFPAATAAAAAAAGARSGGGSGSSANGASAEQQQGVGAARSAVNKAAATATATGELSADEASADAASAAAAGDGDSNASAAASLAAALSAKEAARAARVERARRDLACGLLRELLVLAHRQVGGASGADADLEALQQRVAAEGCSS